MRWRTVCVDVLLLGVLTGCPQDHMPGGSFDRAAHKDVKARLEHNRCNKAKYDELCDGQEDSPECIEECGP
jgi:hypothetical protein